MGSRELANAHRLRSKTTKGRLLIVQRPRYRSRERSDDVHNDTHRCIEFSASRRVTFSVLAQILTDCTNVLLYVWERRPLLSLSTDAIIDSAGLERRSKASWTDSSN